jgi:hypothetical protein
MVVCGERLSKQREFTCKLFAPFYSASTPSQCPTQTLPRGAFKAEVAILNDSAQFMFLCSKYVLQTAGFDGTWLRHFYS